MDHSSPNVLIEGFNANIDVLNAKFAAFFLGTSGGSVVFLGSNCNNSRFPQPHETLLLLAAFPTHPITFPWIVSRDSSHHPCDDRSFQPSASSEEKSVGSAVRRRSAGSSVVHGGVPQIRV